MAGAGRSAGAWPFLAGVAMGAAGAAAWAASSRRRRPRWAKRTLDVVLSGTGLLVSLPLWAAIAAAVKLEDGVVYTRDDRWD